MQAFADITSAELRMPVPYACLCAWLDKGAIKRCAEQAVQADQALQDSIDFLGCGDS